MKRFIPLIVVLAIGGPLWTAAQESPGPIELGPIAVGYRMGGTIPIGETPTTVGTDVALAAGYSKELPWGTLTGMLTTGAGTIGTDSGDLFTARYAMTVVPIGLTVRYNTSATSRFYALAETQLGIAFLNVTYLGDPDVVGRAPEDYTTSWSAGYVGGGYRLRRGMAIEILAGMRAFYFKENVLAQISAQTGLILVPRLMGNDR